MNKPLVLVVEDDTPVRNLITTTLKTHEYRYLSAQNGASAVMEMCIRDRYEWQGKWRRHFAEALPRSMCRPPDTLA